MSVTTDRVASGTQTTPPAAGWGQRPSGGRPGGDRLPAKPRERKPALAALAVLLILGGALASMSLVLRSGEKVDAIGVARDVGRGQRIPLDALQRVQVARSGVAYVPWGQRQQVTRYFAAVPLVRGSLLAQSQVSVSGGVRTGEVVVGLALKPGQFPTTMAVGDTVQAYAVVTSGAASTGAGGSQARLLASSARVFRFAERREGSSIGDSTTQVSIVVARDVAGPLAQAASNGNVALVLVPRAD